MKAALLLLLFTTLGHAQPPNVVFCNGDDQAALKDAQGATITRLGGGGPVFIAAADNCLRRRRAGACPGLRPTQGSALRG